MPRYRILAVDGDDPDIKEEITFLHKVCFAAGGVEETDTGWWWIVYDESNRPVAFAGMKASNWYDDRIYLCRSGVHPDHRGHGLQRKLIHTRLRKARALGFKTAVTDTIHGNHHSANNLIACGFRMFQPEWAWALSDSSYWKRDL